MRSAEYEAELDIHKTGTNHVWAVVRHYGIEAARACLVQEIAFIFNAYV